MVFISFLILSSFKLDAQSNKYALVIGAKEYSSMPPLRNSINDAKSMADVLQKKGFKVDAVYDPTDKPILKAAITRYYESMKNEANAVGVIYYAGHGVQYDGANYIVPINAILKNPGDVNEQCVNMNLVIEVLKSLKHCLNIFLIDACRSYPSFYRDSEEGLAKIQAPVGSVIVFAAQPGKKASDGNGTNGLFTSKLVEHINNDRGSLPEVFRQVRNEVYKESQQGQLPEVVDNTIGGDFYFNPITKTVEKPNEVSTVYPPKLIAKQAQTQSNHKSSINALKKPKEIQVKHSQTPEEQIEKMIETKNYFEAKRLLEPLIQNGEAMAQAIMANLYFNGWGVEKDLIQCLKLNESSALSGDSRGQLQLGVMYLNGWGVTKDEEQAIKWLTYSAESENNDAIVYLGNFYSQKGKDDSGKFKTAFDWLMKGASNGDKRCQYGVAKLYLNGLGVLKDYSEAMKWFSLSANQKFDLATVAIGRMYEEGSGVPVDKAEAVRWYHTAAFSGSADGQFWLAKAYENGSGVTQNMQEAISNFKKAAEQGDRNSMYQLGYIYYTGEGGTTPDFWLSVNWLEKSASAGLVSASRFLAMMFSKEGLYKNLDQQEKWLKFSCELLDIESMYLYGEFLLAKRSTFLANNSNLFDQTINEKQKQILQDAITWLIRASSGGNADAANRLGVVYDSINDDANAMVYFKKAANLGLPVAMFNVGYLYETKKAFGKNKVEAMMWYRMALDKGYKDAKVRLEKLEKRK